MSSAIILVVWVIQLLMVFFEQSPPEIEIVQKSIAIGHDAEKLVFRVKDSGTGLDEIQIRAIQSGRRYQIYRLSHFPDKKISTTEILLESKKIGLFGGKFELHILAFDRSFWSNKAEARWTAEIDLTPPRIELVTVETNTKRGGTGLVFYKVFGGTSSKNGVLIRDRLYDGIPASKIDSRFEKHERTYPFGYWSI